MDHSFTGGLRGTTLSTRQYVVARSQWPPMMNWRPGRKLLLPTLTRYSPNDIYNGDETALFYKSLPHRTYCFDGDKPAGKTLRQTFRQTAYYHQHEWFRPQKVVSIGKSKTPHCLHKKYKMQVKDMSVNWYASKKAWMTGEIHHQIMSKLNNEMRLSNHHILYVCDNASSHQVHDYSHIKFLMLPPMPLRLCSH